MGEFGEISPELTNISGELRNIKLTLEYDGTEFHGWQIQKAARTVQGVLEEALERLLGTVHRVIAASRTDAGAHARGQVVSLHTRSAMPEGRVMLGLNALLPEDVVVRDASKVGLDFNGINHIYISGGFGTFLDIEKAIMIGLLPDLPHKKFNFIGNSSVAGARICLMSKEAREKARLIAEKLTYVELSTDPAFMNEYTSTLFLPHTDMSLFPTVEKKLKEELKI